jgi:hypothetical protein
VCKTWLYFDLRNAMIVQMYLFRLKLIAFRISVWRRAVMNVSTLFNIVFNLGDAPGCASLLIFIKGSTIFLREGLLLSFFLETFSFQ